MELSLDRRQVRGRPVTGGLEAVVAVGMEVRDGGLEVDICRDEGGRKRGQGTEDRGLVRNWFHHSLKALVLSLPLVLLVASMFLLLFFMVILLLLFWMLTMLVMRAAIDNLQILDRLWGRQKGCTAVLIDRGGGRCSRGGIDGPFLMALSIVRIHARWGLGCRGQIQELQR